MTATFSIKGKTLKFNTAEDVADMAKEIRETKGLTDIELSGNTFGVEASKAIAEAIRDQKDLTHIHFADMFTGRLKHEIPLALDAFVDVLLDKNIYELDLSDNAFGPAGAKPLMRLLTQNRTIQVLKLNNNGLGIGGGELISQALVEAQELNEKEGRPSSLRVIQMGRNRLESPGAKFLSAAFAAHCGSLEELRVYQNSIRPDVFPVLMESLGKCTKLVSLDLQDNTLTELGSGALASAVASWPHLKSLNVGECLLRPTGSKALFKALTEGHTVLEKLYLSFNEIDTDASTLLPTLLSNKAQLTLLELNGNEFDPEGSVVKAVLDTLRSHGHPDALDELDEMEWGDESDEESDEEDDEEGASTAAQVDEEDVDALTRAVAQVQV